MAGGNAAQLGQAEDIARANLLGCGGLLALQDGDGAGLLGLLGVCVVQQHVAGQGTGHDLHQAHLADEGVSHGLEDLSREGLAFFADALNFFTGLGVDANLNGAGGRGHDFLDGIQHLGQTNAGNGGAADNGNDGAVLDALAQAVHHFFLRKLAFLEELFH